MTILVHEIPPDYIIKKWHDINNQERWWHSQQMARIERKILMNYNRAYTKDKTEEIWKIYHNPTTDMYTVLEKQS